MNLQTRKWDLQLINEASAYTLALLFRSEVLRPQILKVFERIEVVSLPDLRMLRERAKAEGKLQLYSNLREHVADEEKHSRLFNHALSKCNSKATLIDFDSIPINQFADEYFKSFQNWQRHPKHCQWTTFFASSYVLEKQSYKDLTLMAKLLPAKEHRLKCMLLLIAEDEKKHAAYLLQELQNYYSLPDLSKILDNWRKRRIVALIQIVTGAIFQRSNITQKATRGTNMNLKKFQNILAWILSIFSTVLGIASLFLGNLAGITFLLIGIAFLPSLKLPEFVRIAAAIIGVFFI